MRIGSFVIKDLLLGYIRTANAFLHRDVERELRPMLHQSKDGLRKLLSEISEVPSAALLLATGFGLAAEAAMGSLDPGIRRTHSGLSVLDPRFLWLLAHNSVVLALGLRLSVTEIQVSRVYGRIGEELVDVDLFDLAPLAPFARKEQQSVLLSAVLSAIFSWFWVLGAAGRANVVIGFFVAVVVTSAFPQPAVGVRRRIRPAKRAELEQVHDALRLERERLLEAGRAAAEPRPRMADLVAYR